MFDAGVEALTDVPAGVRRFSHGEREGGVEDSLLALQLVGAPEQGGAQASLSTLQARHRLDQRPEPLGDHQPAARPRMFGEVAADQVMLVADRLPVFPPLSEKQPRRFQSACSQDELLGPDRAALTFQIGDLECLERRACLVRNDPDDRRMQQNLQGPGRRKIGAAADGEALEPLVEPPAGRFDQRTIKVEAMVTLPIGTGSAHLVRRQVEQLPGFVIIGGQGFLAERPSAAGHPGAFFEIDRIELR